MFIQKKNNINNQIDPRYNINIIDNINNAKHNSYSRSNKVMPPASEF